MISTKKRGMSPADESVPTGKRKNQQKPRAENGNARSVPAAVDEGGPIWYNKTQQKRELKADEICNAVHGAGERTKQKFGF